MDEYSLEYIENMRIHELRDYARKIGVTSPTTMRKEDLIQKINQIVASRSEEEEFFDRLRGKEKKIDFYALLKKSNDEFIQSLLSKNSRIRRIEKKSSREKNNSNKLSNAVIMKNENNQTDDSYYNIDRSLYSLKFNISQNQAEYGDDVEDIRSGYVFVTSEKYGIVLGDKFVSNSDLDSYIPEGTMQRFNIQMGDYVTGVVKPILEDCPLVMGEILSIEGSNQSIKTQFNNYTYNGKGDNLYLDKFNLDIKKGERVYIQNMSLEDAVKLGYDVVDENSASVKFLNVKALPEDNYKSNQKLEIINLKFNIPEVEVVKTLDVVNGRIQREFENKKPNVLIIYNFSELIRIANAGFQGVYDFNRFDARAINKITNALCLAKFFDDSHYVSVICIDKCGISSDLASVINTELMPLFNNVLDSVEKK